MTASAVASRRFVVGLTGGIGSGKTAVSNTLAQLGADIIDTDVIAHQLTAPGGEAMPAIVAAFGNQAARPDGSMDRDYIRQRVFSDGDALKQLEAILHPLIRQNAMLQLAQGRGPYAVMVVPLLIEKQGWRDLLAATLVVDCPEEEQVRRVHLRSGLADEQIRSIMARQASRQQRLSAATHVLLNDGDLAHLQAQAEQLHREFLDRSRQNICTPPCK